MVLILAILEPHNMKICVTSLLQMKTLNRPEIIFQRNEWWTLIRILVTHQLYFFQYHPHTGIAPENVPSKSQPANDLYYPKGKSVIDYVLEDKFSR